MSFPFDFRSLCVVSALGLSSVSWAMSNPATEEQPAVQPAPIAEQEAPVAVEQPNVEDPSTTQPASELPAAEQTDTITGASLTNHLIDSVTTGQTSDPSPAIVHEERPITVAMIMPADNSEVSSAAQIIAQGLTIAGENTTPPTKVILIEGPASVTPEEQIHAAALAGADAIVGPIMRERIASLLNMKSMPVPVVALNIVPTEKVPEGLSMMGASVDEEAKAIADMAVKQALEIIAKRPMPINEITQTPATTEQNTSSESNAAAPVVATADQNADASLNAPATATESSTQPEQPFEPLKVAILKTEGAWESRIVEGYEQSLKQNNIPYEVMLVDRSKLNELKKTLEPVLSPEILEEYQHNRQAIVDDEELTDTQKEKKLKALEQELRTTQATAIPPYEVVLLAMDMRSASLVRSLIPLKSSVWGTSTVNPGNPELSSVALTLAYDLNDLNFLESPMLFKYKPSQFESKYHIPLPTNASEQRLLALGIDALTVARNVAQNKSEFSFRGETGNLSFNKAQAPIINRRADRIVIQSGNLIDQDLSADEIKQRDVIEDNKSQEELTPSFALPKVQNSLQSSKPLEIKTVVVPETP